MSSLPDLSRPYPFFSISSSPVEFRFVPSCSISFCHTTSHSVASQSFPAYPFLSRAIPPRFAQACLVEIHLLQPCPLFSIDSRSILFCYILFWPSKSKSPPFPTIPSCPVPPLPVPPRPVITRPTLTHSVPSCLAQSRSVLLVQSPTVSSQAAFLSFQPVPFCPAPYY